MVSAYLLNSYPKDSIVIIPEKIREPKIIFSEGTSVTKSNAAKEPKKEIIKLLPILATDFFQFNTQQFYFSHPTKRSIHDSSIVRKFFDIVSRLVEIFIR